MYILEQDNGVSEANTPIAVGRNPFNLAEYAIKYGGYGAAGWSLQEAVSEGYVIRGYDSSVLYWIREIPEVVSVGVAE